MLCWILLFCWLFVFVGDAGRLYLGYACVDFVGLLSVSESDGLVAFSASILSTVCIGVLIPVNSKTTGTLTQYNNPYNRMKPG